MNKIEEKRKRINDLENEIEQIKEELKELNDYDSVIVLNVHTTLENYKNIINEMSKITNYYSLEDMGIRKLAYEVKSNLEGYYVLIHFVGNSEVVRELEKFYRIKDEILKFATVIKENDDYDDVK